MTGAEYITKDRLRDLWGRIENIDRGVYRAL